MTNTRIDRIRTLLKGIETGDPHAVAVISPTQYIQHNPQTHTGESDHGNRWSIVHVR